MRNVLLFSAAALALTACSPKADNSADNGMSGTGGLITDNATLVGNDTAGGDTAANGAANATASASTPDFIANAASSDMYEIASSKLATANASSAGIKKFASEMIAAHTRTTAGLKAAIAKDGVKETPPPAMNAEHQALVDALKGAKGETFDTLYKTQQTEAHTKTLALMQGYATTGDQPALKAFASDTAPKVKMHLDMLNKM